MGYAVAKDSYAPPSDQTTDRKANDQRLRQETAGHLARSKGLEPLTF